jgi:hypothetical protein
VSDFSDGDIGKPSLLSAAMFTTAIPVACRSAGHAFTDAPCRNGRSVDARVPVCTFPPLSLSLYLALALCSLNHAAILLGMPARGEERTSRIARARASPFKKKKIFFKLKKKVQTA